MESSMNRGMVEGSQMTDEIEQLKSGFSQLRGDVVNLFTHAFGLGRTGAAAARESAADAMESLKSRLSDWKERGTDSFNTYEKEFEKKVSENPISSALIAFGVGFMVAKMFHHRRH